MNKRLKIKLDDLVLVLLILFLFAGTIFKSQAQNVKSHPRVFFQKNELKEFADIDWCEGILTLPVGGSKNQNIEITLIN